MSEVTIDLVKPITVTNKANGGEEIREISTLEMRSPTLNDFSGVSVNDPTMGQMVAVAARCCVNVPASKFIAMPAENLMEVARWIGGFLMASR